MTTPNNTPSCCKKSLFGLTLLASVVLNLLLAGVMLGVIPTNKHHHFGPMALAAPHGDHMVEWMTRSLAPDDATAFRESIHAQDDALKQAHKNVHQALKEAAAAFAQDPTDAAALHAALDHLNQARAEKDGIVGSIIQNVAPKLSAEGRSHLADLAD